MSRPQSVSDIYRQYLERYAFNAEYNATVAVNPDIIIVIPVHNERSVLSVVKSIDISDKKGLNIIIILIFNAGECADEKLIQLNQSAAGEIREYLKDHNETEIIILEYNQLPDKTAGVGLARKAGMDYAVRIFSFCQKNGIICCLDADSLVEKNYLTEVHKMFSSHPDWDAASIYFEHPLSGNDFPPEIYQAISQYELHLRYYIRIQKWIGLPYAFQTVGSSMAVRSISYCRYGGMNTRKAGEDFYFLQKIISKGFCGEIKTTKVIPSPRISDRVPFGTGKAVGGLVKTKDRILNTYHPDAFTEVSDWIQSMPLWYEKPWNGVYNNLPYGITYWLNMQNFDSITVECKKHTSSFQSFRKRIFQWFDAFRLMKFLHWYRDHIKADIPVTDAAKWLLEQMKIEYSNADATKLMLLYRHLDKYNEKPLFNH